MRHPARLALSQGYFFARPLAADAWADLLRSDLVGNAPDASEPESTRAEDNAAVAAVKRCHKSKKAA